MSATPELRAAGFDLGCDACRRAVASGREACTEHYVPTHERQTPWECPRCGGRKPEGDDLCGRCKARSP